MRLYRQVIGIAVLLCACVSARGDEVFLANGDRISGTVVRKEGAELILRTPYAGEIKIAWGQIVRVQTDEPMELVLSDFTATHAAAVGTLKRPPPGKSAPTAPTAHATPQPAAPDANAATAEASAPEPAPAEPPTIPIDRVAYINAGAGINVLGVRWKGRVNLGGGGNRGNTDTDNLLVDAEAVARQQQNRLTLNAVFNWGKDRDRLTKHNWRVSGKYDLFIGPRWYGYALGELEDDRFRDIDRRTTVGTGIGHQLVDDERTHLALEGGLSYVHTNFHLAADEAYPAARWAVRYDQRLFGTEMQVFHNHELVANLEDLGRAFVRSQTGLRLPLLKRLMATAQLNVDHDTDPAPGKANTDRVYLFTVGYHW